MKQQINELAQILDDNNLHEIRLEQDDEKLVVRRNSDGNHAPAIITMPAHEAPSPPDETASSGNDAVCAPMVGTVYLAPNPTSDPFVKQGQRVEAGDTVMIIEAMKVMNSIQAHQSGIVQKILVGDAQAVEFGQPLIVIV
ncbi:MAG: acetyl-CoA carboxylase biotin carboxyl carrier protein subunit [Pseudomonadota bacterium]